MKLYSISLVCIVIACSCSSTVPKTNLQYTWKADVEETGPSLLLEWQEVLDSMTVQSPIILECILLWPTYDTLSNGDIYAITEIIPIHQYRGPEFLKTASLRHVVQIPIGEYRNITHWEIGLGGNPRLLPLVVYLKEMDTENYPTKIAQTGDHKYLEYFDKQKGGMILQFGEDLKDKDYDFDGGFSLLFQYKRDFDHYLKHFENIELPPKVLFDSRAKRLKRLQSFLEKYNENASLYW